MHQLDWIIVVVLLSVMVGGYRMGFVARAASWVGLIVGFIAAIKLLPSLISHAGSLSASNQLGLAMLLIVSGSILGQILGLLAGSHFSRTLPPGPLQVVDRVVGAILGAGGVLVTIWLLSQTAANVPGWPARQVRNSVIARTIYADTPKPPDTLQALRRLMGSSQFPSVFEGLTPAPDSGPAPSSVSLPATVLSDVRASTVKVEGIACQRLQEGSGFVVAPDLIATNAHVVAGDTHTDVLLPTGKTLNATVVLFDPERDLALLQVSRDPQPALPFAAPKDGEVGAVFGHPGGQDALSVQPAAVRQRIAAVGRDLYDVHQTRRQVLVLAAQLRQGDSGGALVNDQGQVIGVAFAIAPDRTDVAYALDVSELQAALGQPHQSQVGTGTCLND